MIILLGRIRCTIRNVLGQADFGKCQGIGRDVFPLIPIIHVIVQIIRDSDAVVLKIVGLEVSVNWRVASSMMWIGNVIAFPL